jgi:hypothetical protein
MSGSNMATEGIKMPEGWNWIKTDAKNIRSIAKTRNIKIKTFPIISTLDYVFNRVVRKIHWVSILDLYDFNKENALKLLEESYGYKRYPYKHYESIFTRFYQGYILPEKFGVDKRKLHLSTLIMSKQITREQALQALKSNPYPEIEKLEEDKEYFLKKMKLEESQFQNYLSRSVKYHDKYASEKIFWNLLRKLKKML